MVEINKDKIFWQCCGFGWVLLGFVFEKKPDQTFKKKPEPDLTFEKRKPDPAPIPEKKPGSGFNLIFTI